MTTTMLQAKALYANQADTEEELSFAAGDVLAVHERDVAGLVGWWLCSHAGRIGIAPGNRLRLLTPTSDQQSNIEEHDSSSTKKPRPATAPQRRQPAQSNGSVNNQLVVPRKSGNVYVYNDAVQQGADYDVPATRYATQPTFNACVTAAAADSLSQDYDIPPGMSPTSRCVDDDVDFGVGDYDLLSPPQQPSSDISSNRSSVTSVISGGSVSSGTASVRSAQSPFVRSTSATGARLNGCDPHLGSQSAPRLCISEATSDSSADSGIAALNSPVKSATSSLNGGVSCNRNGTATDVDCLDYDVPMASVNELEGRRLEAVNERRSTTPQSQRPAPAEHVSPVISDERRHGNDGRCALNGRRRRVEELSDCVMRAVQRFLTWTGRATGDPGSDAVAARQCYGQAKLAGLAVRTSLKELVSVVDGNPPELVRQHVDALNKSLFEIDHRLDCLIASGSDIRTQRLAGSSTSGRRAARESSVGRGQLLAVAEIVADLPELVRRFAEFASTNPAVVLRPRDDVDVIQTSPPSCVPVRTLPPPPPQRRDSRQRDKPPQSPPAVAGGNAPAGRPPLGKPPPVKPKPPKSVTWKRPPQTLVEPRPAGSSGPRIDDGTASRPNSAKQERLSRKNGPTSDGWNDDDCDYVSIVREVEREMESLGQPATKKNSTPATGGGGTSPAPLSDDDRELLAFYSAQISAHAADVDAASADFYGCCRSPSPCVDAFVRRSRFVVLAAHRLVYVGDVIARHVTDQSVRDRVAAAANALCDRLKAVVVATRDAAIATTAENENPAAAAAVRQTMMESVRRATDDSRRLCGIISAITSC